MKTKIHFRMFEPGDEGRLYDLVYKVFKAHIAPIFSERGVQEFLGYIQPGCFVERNHSDHFQVLAETGELVVGLIEIRDFKHISLLFVETDRHRQGIARSLVDRAIEICLAQHPGLSSIGVNSSPNAVSIYQRLGFSPVSEELTVNGIRFVSMVKHINGQRDDDSI